MKRISVLLRLGLLLLVSLGLSFAVVTASGGGGGNRCTDHCADVYKIRKDACKLIPFKTERRICERRAKETKEDCKHRCR